MQAPHPTHLEVSIIAAYVFPLPQSSIRTRLLTVPSYSQRPELLRLLSLA